MKTIIQGLQGATVKSTITIEYRNGTISIKIWELVNILHCLN